jgi:hypothetical protein
MTDRPASWRMPTPRQMNSFCPCFGADRRRNFAPIDLGPYEDQARNVLFGATPLSSLRAFEVIIHRYRSDHMDPPFTFDLAQPGQAHRAQRLLQILALELPTTGAPALVVLLETARRRTVLVWAEPSPFDLKDSL